MQVRILKESYLNSEELYEDFLKDQIVSDLDHFTNITYNFEKLKPFPIYLNYKNEEVREKKFFEALYVIRDYYLELDKEITMSQSFWQSLLLVNFREYILHNYPHVKKSRNTFNNIVLKRFDWENYIYKCLLAVEYVTDQISGHEHDHYFSLIINNLDLFNYLIKYTVFRNDKFILTILKIVDKHNLSLKLKAKIRNRPDLGKDERYGRRVIFEFNKEYPVILSPMMTEEFIEKSFIKHLNKYVIT